MRPKQPLSPTVFGVRLRMGIPQDKLGVLIGLDEGCASARVSRYESGHHAPPYETGQKLAGALGVPTAYLYCDRDELANLLLAAGDLDAGCLADLVKAAERLKK